MMRYFIFKCETKQNKLIVVVVVTLIINSVNIEREHDEYYLGTMCVLYEKIYSKIFFILNRSIQSSCNIQ